MNNWKIRLAGLFLMGIGGWLFVLSVRDISAEWPQILVGLLSVFCLAMGFGLLIMPLRAISASQPENKDDSAPV